MEARFLQHELEQRLQQRAFLDNDDLEVVSRRLRGSACREMLQFLYVCRFFPLLLLLMPPYPGYGGACGPSGRVASHTP